MMLANVMIQVAVRVVGGEQVLVLSHGRHGSARRAWHHAVMIVVLVRRRRRLHLAPLNTRHSTINLI